MMLDVRMSTLCRVMFRITSENFFEPDAVQKEANMVAACRGLASSFAKPSCRLNSKTTCDIVHTDQGVLSVPRSSEASGIARKRKVSDVVESVGVCSLGTKHLKSTAKAADESFSSDPSASSNGGSHAGSAAVVSALAVSAVGLGALACASARRSLAGGDVAATGHALGAPSQPPVATSSQEVGGNGLAGVGNALAVASPVRRSSEEVARIAEQRVLHAAGRGIGDQASVDEMRFRRES